MCLDVLPAGVSMHTHVPYAEGNQKKALDSLQSEITGSCELHVGTGN